MLDRFIANWVYGGFLAGLLLLALTPFLAHAWPRPVALVFLCLPVYMLHQYEEHDNDRFRLFVNKTVGRGNDVLSPWTVFLANIPGVWGVIGLSFVLAASCNIGFGLIAAYLVGLNAVVHIIPAIVSRTYNPGLLTAILLFIPLACVAIYSVQRGGGGALPMDVLGATAAIAIHAAIVIPVLKKSSKLMR